MLKTAIKTRLKITLDLRPVREKILGHLQAQGGQEQRRWVRRYFGRMKGFKQAYRDLLDQCVISEQGRGIKNDPVLTVLQDGVYVD